MIDVILEILIEFQWNRDEFLRSITKSSGHGKKKIIKLANWIDWIEANHPNGGD